MLTEKLPFAEIRDGKFRRHHHRPVLADFVYLTPQILGMALSLRGWEAVSTHCKKAKLLKNIDSVDLTELFKFNGLRSDTKLIPETDVYRLVMRSKFESAEKFQDWFVAGDMAKALEYSETAKMLQHCDESANMVELNKINELGLILARVGGGVNELFTPTADAWVIALLLGLYWVKDG